MSLGLLLYGLKLLSLLQFYQLAWRVSVFFRMRNLLLDGPGSAQVLRSRCPVQQAGAARGDRGAPKTTLCPMLSLRLTQEEVSRDFFFGLGHTGLTK